MLNTLPIETRTSPKATRANASPNGPRSRKGSPQCNAGSATMPREYSRTQAAFAPGNADAPRKLGNPPNDVERWRLARSRDDITRRPVFAWGPAPDCPHRWLWAGRGRDRQLSCCQHSAPAFGSSWMSSCQSSSFGLRPEPECEVLAVIGANLGTIGSTPWSRSRAKRARYVAACEAGANHGDSRQGRLARRDRRCLISSRDSGPRPPTRVAMRAASRAAKAPSRRPK